jgi:hypothetical protein
MLHWMVDGIAFAAMFTNLIGRDAHRAFPLLLNARDRAKHGASESSLGRIHLRAIREIVTVTERPRGNAKVAAGCVERMRATGDAGVYAGISKEGDR